MRHLLYPPSLLLSSVAALLLTTPIGTLADSNLVIRVMSANITSGNFQSYETPGINIFQGLKPDIVAIQEFKYANSSATAQLDILVATAFGTNFFYYREPYTAGSDIPNGIVSRWPIRASGSWDDPIINNRGFAWAQIDLPGPNDLYVVSVHLYSGGTDEQRDTEANVIKDSVQTNFPAGAWVIVGGDMNSSPRTEAAIETFKTFLSDAPVPSDGRATTNATYTNAGRTSPYDYVFPSFSMTNRLTPVRLPSNTFSNGLVFDSRIYTPLTDVSPVVIGDSGVSGMQHMAVVRDFLIPVETNTPLFISTQPTNQTVNLGSPVTFQISAAGTTPLVYQWRFNGANISGANTNTYFIASAQDTNAGSYTVVITNVAGNVTSAVATLTVNGPPVITTQPTNQTVNLGSPVTFHVSASGTAPLVYHWRHFDTNLPGATASSFNLASAQLADAGNYVVVVTNVAGSVTSAVAVLTVTPPPSGLVIAQWNFNSVPPNAATTNGTLLPAIGSGSANYVGGTLAAGSGEFATGSSTDTNATDNSGWNTSSYPSVTNGNKSAGVRFDVSTAIWQNIVIRWDQRVSSTGSKYSRLQYTTNGTAFWDYPTATNVVTAAAFEPRTNSLSSIPGVNNSASFGFRIVSEFESTATGSGTNAYVGASGNYAATGTVRFDMVTVFGDPLTVSNPPPAAAVLSATTFSAGQFQMLVTGSAGTNYIVQATTNLASPSWVSLRTNSSPFTFTDTNTAAFPVKFYRALWQP